MKSALVFFIAKIGTSWSNIEAEIDKTISCRLQNVDVFKVYGNGSTYEKPGIDKVIELSRFSSYDVIGYCHTKGVTAKDDEKWKHYWRKLMVLNTLYYGNECISLLKSNYDTIGFNWMGINKCQSHPHYSGNFWWGTREYLKTLPLLAEYDIKNKNKSWYRSRIKKEKSDICRNIYEFWIGANSPAAYQDPVCEYSFEKNSSEYASNFEEMSTRIHRFFSTINASNCQ